MRSRKRGAAPGEQIRGRRRCKSASMRASDPDRRAVRPIATRGGSPIFAVSSATRTKGSGASATAKTQCRTRLRLFGREDSMTRDHRQVIREQREIHDSQAGRGIMSMELADGTIDVADAEHRLRCTASDPRQRARRNEAARDGVPLLGRRRSGRQPLGARRRHAAADRRGRRGPSAPGAQPARRCGLPFGGLVWKPDRRGDLVFVAQAGRQCSSSALRITDGGGFLHGWTQVVAWVVSGSIPSAAPVSVRLSDRAGAPPCEASVPPPPPRVSING